MTSVCRPGFRAVEYCGEDDCPVKFQFGFKANSTPTHFLHTSILFLMTKKLCLCLSPLPDIHPQSFKGDTCLGDSVVDLGINVGIAGACTTQVCEGLYHLKGLAVH